MAETVEGGRYQNKDGSFVDANGKVLKPAPVVVVEGEGDKPKAK